MNKLLRIFLLVLFLFCNIILPSSAEPNGIVIEGLSLTKMAGAKPVYSIEADKAALDNKEIGFFKLGLVKVFNLDNVYLTQYENGQIVKREHFNRAVYEITAKRLLDEHGNLLFVGS